MKEILAKYEWFILAGLVLVMAGLLMVFNLGEDTQQQPEGQPEDVEVFQHKDMTCITHKSHGVCEPTTEMNGEWRKW